jgi:hypothetical protein
MSTVRPVEGLCFDRLSTNELANKSGRIIKSRRRRGFRLRARCPAVEDVEEGLLERRRDIALDHLDLGFVADDRVALLDRADAADVALGLPLTTVVCASGNQPFPCQITDLNQDDAVAIKTECGVVGQ